MEYILFIVCKSLRYPLELECPVVHRAGLDASEGKCVCFHCWGSKLEPFAVELRVLIHILTFIWHYALNF
jgi:hypothetical protein